MLRKSIDPPQDRAPRARGTKEAELNKHLLAADHVILGAGAVGIAMAMAMAMAMADMLVAETSAEALMSSGIEAVVEGEPW